MGIKDRVLLEKQVPASAQTINEMANPKYISKDKAIPLALLKRCEGIAFITIYKAGIFMVGGKVGGGCVITKIKDPNAPNGFRWSGPVGIQVGGLQGGFVFGGEKIQSIIILNTPGAIRALYGKGQVQLGGSMSLAAGPTGRDASAALGVSDTKELAPSYSYSIAKGAYIGATLDGAVLKINQEDTNSYFGNSVIAEDILTGKVAPPPKANILYDSLNAVLSESPSSSSTFSAPMSTSPVAQTNEQLPPGWKTLYTEDGKPYYFNEVANTTHWEKPEVVVQPPPPAPAPVPPPPPATLPVGWEELKTPEGKPYYYNKNTNTTQWEKPIY